MKSGNLLFVRCQIRRCESKDEEIDYSARFACRSVLFRHSP